MNVNEQKLEKWYQSTLQYERLGISEVKSLLSELGMAQNFEQKQALRERIILGTMHVIYEVIKSNEIYFLDNSYYDMDDIIQAHIETLIRAVDSGELNNVKDWFRFFDKKLVQITSDLVGKNDQSYMKDFLLLLNYFLEENPSYANFITFFQNNSGTPIDNVQSRELNEMYLLLSDIAKFVFDNVDEKAISDVKKRMLKDLLISFRNQEMYEDRIVAGYDIEEFVTDKVYYQQISDAVAKGLHQPHSTDKMPDRISVVLDSRFKENMTFEEIAQKLGVCCEQARKIYERALREARGVINNRLNR